jgi:uncharacterized protein (DUF302 family)
MNTRLPSMTVPQAVEKVTAALAQQGFGVLTTIDTQATFKKKLDVETHPRVILGACNPQLALKALALDPGMSLLMPCNVVVEQPDAGGPVEVNVLDPALMADLSRTRKDDAEFRELLAGARDRLQKMLDSLKD